MRTTLVPLALALGLSAVTSASTCDGPVYRLARSFLGSWAEYETTEDGEQLVGTLDVVPVAGGCALSQRFESADASFGFVSLATVDEASGGWTETILFSTGRTAEYRWRAAGGDVVFDRLGDDPEKRERLRATQIGADSFVVLEERSSDGGRTWTTVGRTPTRRIPAEAGTPPGGPSAKLMTFDEYREVPHVVPYVLDISAAGGRLVYVGSHHTYDPGSLDVRLVEQLWDRVRPVLAFNEGGNPPTLADRDQAVRLHGESGLVRHLAARDGVPVASLDPTHAELVAALRGEFSELQLKLFFTLRQVNHHRNNAVEPFEAMIERVFRVLGGMPGLEGPPGSVPELAAAYEELFPGQGSFRQVPDSWFDPVRQDTLLNDIARRASILRDTFMVELLTRRTLEGHRVFAVVGASHVVMQEALIRQLLTAGAGTSP